MEDLMEGLALPIVHPAFERTRQTGRWLHLIAGLLILGHALSHLRQPELGPVYFWCQLIIASDIFILVASGRNMLVQLPAVNLIFRIIEILFFLGISLMMASMQQWLISLVHGLLFFAYVFLLYCERQLRTEARLTILHSGVAIPGIPANTFLLWTEINHIESHYDSIRIETSLRKEFGFDFRHNLSFGQLQQIQEFCRHYLGEVPA
jgi:hypothetical protein